ncbi:MAG: methylmalonyl-CoA mutase subunit beta, partial [Alphaproteobacteria bacterium]
MTDPSNLDFVSDFPRATRERWLAAVDGALKGKPFEKTLVGKTADGLRIEPLYDRATTSSPLAGREPGAPWTIVQRVDNPDVTVANVQALEDLNGGASGLVLVTKGGIGDRRGDGVVIERLSDIEALFDGIMLDLVALRIDAGTAGGHVAAMIAAYAAKHQIDPASLTIAFGIDPISAFARRGTLEDWRSAVAKSVDATLGLTTRGFRGAALMADGRVVHDAGGSEAQELAFALGAVVDYWRGLEAGGVTLDAARRAVAVTLAADANQFLTTAKMRAMRLLFARAEVACGLEPSVLDLHAETAWRMVSRVDPAVNWLRTTVACAAAGMGGANHVTVQPWTAALGLPDSFGRRIARNTQLILIEESNLHRVTDPAAGSGGVEALTMQLAEAAWALFQADEAVGGLVAALSSGVVQARIAETNAARKKAIATRREPLTGTSEFPNIAEARQDVLTPTVPAKPVAGMARVLPAAGAGARFTALVEAFTAGAVRAELSRPKTDRVFVSPLIPYRLAEPFEASREALDA